MPASLSCPICNARSSLCYSGCRDMEYFIPYTADFYRCESCGLVFMNPLPATADLASLYPDDYLNFAKPTNPVSAFLLARFHENHAAICRRHLQTDGRMLEIGAAGGDLLGLLASQGYRHVKGIELSATACELARERGLDVRHTAIEEFDTAERFDLIFMSHVIEHVIDPAATVKKLASLLTPGGVLYVETPNVGALDARIWGRHWGLIHYPRHLHLFDHRTLPALLRAEGLEVEPVRWEINSCGWALSIQSALRRIGVDRSRRARSFYYPLLLVLCLPLNAIDVMLGGTAFMATVARRTDSAVDA
jgi:SAM-dependent methyltransferase